MAVARPGVASGLRLAGLEPLEAVGTDATIRRLEESTAGDPALILVEDSLWDALPPEVRDRFETRPFPLVVPFPSPTPETPEARAEAYLVDMLRRAVGYRVRLR